MTTEWTIAGIIVWVLIFIIVLIYSAARLLSKFEKLAYSILKKGECRD